MQTELKTNTIVILARSHNPTLISDAFLIDSNIISSVEEINPNNRIITPAFTQIQFISGTKMILEAEKLIISGAPGKDPYEKASAYCNALGYIKGEALGINFDYLVQDKLINDWFNNRKIKNYSVKEIKLELIEKTYKINISVLKETDISCKVTFNFHYDIKDKMLKYLELDFVKEWLQNRDKSEVIVNQILKD